MAAPGLPAPTGLLDPIATVYGQPITGDQVVLGLVLSGTEQPSFVPRGYTSTGSSTAQAHQDAVIAYLVLQAAMAHEASRLGLRATAEQKRAAIAEAVASPQLVRTGFSAGGTRSVAVAALATRALLADALEKRLQAAARRRYLPTAQQVRAYYLAHQAEFRYPVAREIAVILVRTEADASAIERRLKAGESFAAIAEQESLDASTRFDGGRTKLVTGSGAAAVDRAAARLKKGAVSQPVRSDRGWWIAKALTDATGQRVRPFAEVRATLTEQLSIGVETKAATLVQSQERALLNEAPHHAVFAPGFEPRTLTLADAAADLTD